MKSPRLLASLVLLSTLAACDDLAPPKGVTDAGILPSDGGDVDGGVPAGGPHVLHVPYGTGFRAYVDAVDTVAYVYLDLDTGLEVAGDDPSWDLRIRRFEIALNGGTTGEGGVEVALVEGTPIGGVTEAPASGYVTDDGATFAFGTWYAYDETTHVLTPVVRTYVVRSTEGEAFAIQLLGYYDGAGTSGHPSFAWTRLEGAPGNVTPQAARLEP